MNELTKRIVSCVLLLIIGLGCFFGISRQHLQLFRLCRETRAAPSQKSWLISRRTF